MELEELLKSKPLYYKEFDPQRIIEAYNVLKPHIKQPKRVQLIGTNGKGSTGRVIAYLAARASLNVGHYTSPHIYNFKERFWHNGKFATTKELEAAHQKLFIILGRETSLSLSYFEYLTLLTFVVFEDCDLQVIEAGLGGEFDATSVVNYTLTVVTPIGFDHSDFLGDSLEDIARTKLKAIANKALIAKQNSESVNTIAKQIATEKGSALYFYKDLLPKNSEQITAIAKEKGWADYLVENILNATFALDILSIDYNLKDLKSLKLFGRFYKLLPHVTIDVGHNPLAATVIVRELKKKVILIFNILDDKDLSKSLEILKPKIEAVEIIKIDTQRATDLKKIELLLENMGLQYKYFNGKLDENRDYLVFGSFYVVEAFLRELGILEINV